MSLSELPAHTWFWKEVPFKAEVLSREHMKLHFKSSESFSPLTSTEEDIHVFPGMHCGTDMMDGFQGTIQGFCGRFSRSCNLPERRQVSCQAIYYDVLHSQYTNKSNYPKYVCVELLVFTKILVLCNCLWRRFFRLEISRSFYITLKNRGRLRKMRCDNSSDPAC